MSAGWVSLSLSWSVGGGDASAALNRRCWKPRVEVMLGVPMRPCDETQMSAAAFAKALLDLEGTSLAPILVSLVEKDSSMLEAYGKVRARRARLTLNV